MKGKVERERGGESGMYQYEREGESREEREEREEQTLIERERERERDIHLTEGTKSSLNFPLRNGSEPALRSNVLNSFELWQMTPTEPEREGEKEAERTRL